LLSKKNQRVKLFGMITGDEAVSVFQNSDVCLFESVSIDISHLENF
jgi:hypothetical protein